MSELRQDPTTLGWVLVAPERARRPGEHGADASRARAGSGACPLCPGHETETPPELWRLPAPAGGWRVRVVPNRFPLLGADEGLSAGSDSFRALGGRGWHEVVVETPDHSWDMALGTPEEIRRVLEAYRVRYHALRRRGAELVVIFRNHGAASGTSLEHPHSQVVGTPVVPRLVRSRIDVARQRYDDAGSCLYLEVLERELRAERRVLIGDDRLVAFQPFAPSASYETWIMPRFHQPSFGDASPDVLDELARVLRGVLGALRAALDDPAYNLVVHSAPAGEEHLRYFVWHVRITPRLGTPAGFELATGIPVVSVLPEESAARLRSLL
jgi:UDPglucose--hexose-1-phosphate uridylyltransferase